MIRTLDVQEIFVNCKVFLKRTELLAYPQKELNVHRHFGTCLEQWPGKVWPNNLAFILARSLTNARESLVVYRDIKYFHVKVEGHHLSIFPDDKTLSYAVNKRAAKSSPPHLRQLDFIVNLQPN